MTTKITAIALKAHTELVYAFLEADSAAPDFDDDAVPVAAAEAVSIAAQPDVQSVVARASSSLSLPALPSRFMKSP